MVRISIQGIKSGCIIKMWEFIRMMAKIIKEEIKLPKRKKWLNAVVLVGFLVTVVMGYSPVAYGVNVADTNGHWAEASISEMISQGIISGYPDGTFKPEGKITRAEFATLIVKGFKLSNSARKTFNDTANHWAKDAIAIANANGIVSGYSDTTFGPNDPITREQMAVMIVKAANLTNSTNAKTFADSQNIAACAKDAVAIASSNNLISGYAADNTFKAKNNTTRAEATVVLSKSLKPTTPSVVEPEKPDYSVIDKAGTYGPKTGSETVAGNVTVKAKGTTLQNLIIKGDLIIAKEVGDGDVTLNNIKVGGKTYIRGGGKDSIHIKGGEYKDVIVESTATGAVRIVATNAAGLQVVIAENAKGEEIILNGEFKNVTINANDVKVTTQKDTTIGEVKVASGLKDVNIELAKDSSVKAMVLDSKVEVKGEGTIKEASGNQAKESKFAQTPDKIATTTNTGGGGGGGGGGTPAVTTASVANASELTTALANSNITTITLTGNITASPTIIRSLTINFGAYTLTGDVKFEHNLTGTSVLTGNAGNRIIGKLTVKTPNASFTNGVKVSGSVVVEEIKVGTWTESADGNTLTITDNSGATITIIGKPGSVTVSETAGGTLTITVNSGATVDSIISNAPVNITVSAGATVTSVTAETGSTGSTITNNGTMNTLTVNAPVAFVANVAPITTTVGATGSADISGTAANQIVTVNVTGITVKGAGDAATITANNGTLQMGATITPANATNKGVTWLVKNTDNSATDKATINTTGLLTAVKNGAVKVIATAKDGSGISGEKEITISGQIPVIATTSTIANGAVNPVVVITLAKDTFTAEGTSNIIANWTGSPGTSGLIGGVITRNSDTQITFNLSGTAQAGTMTLQAKAEALASGVASNIISIIIPEATTVAINPITAASMGMRKGSIIMDYTFEDNGNVITYAQALSDTYALDPENSTVTLYKNTAQIGNTVKFSALTFAAPDAGKSAKVIFTDFNELLSKFALNMGMPPNPANIPDQVKVVVKSKTIVGGKAVANPWGPITHTENVSSELYSGPAIDVNNSTATITPGNKTAGQPFPVMINIKDAQNANLPNGNFAVEISANGSPIGGGAEISFTNGQASVNALLAPAGTYTLVVKVNNIEIESIANVEAVSSPILAQIESTMDGSAIHLTFDKAMADPSGKHSQFAVTVNGAANPITAAALKEGDNKTIVLTLTTALAGSETVTVAYTQGDVVAADNGILCTFTPQAMGGTSEPFAPGAGGTLPAFTPFTPIANTIPGLYVDRSQRWNNAFDGGTYANVDLYFPTPSIHGATSYTLQYSTDSNAWNNYEHEVGTPLTTINNSQDNFSISPGESYYYRLLVTGGDKDGYTSNVVNAPLSAINTYFSGWNLDESMTISGTMVPWVGRGLEASFEIKKLADDSVVDSVYPSYQWYRINPLTYEMTLINGATNLNYITTPADVGYGFIIRATGDETNIGGFAQIISTPYTLIPNKAYISDVTATGFTLNLYQGVDSLSISDLILTDKDSNPISITGVTPIGDSKAIYAITANVPVANAPFTLHNNSHFWRIASEPTDMPPGGHMLHEGVQFPDNLVEP